LFLALFGNQIDYLVMNSSVGMSSDTDSARQNQRAVGSKGRRQTRKGKARLLTLDALDARTAAYAAAKRLVSAISADLGNDLTAGERQLVQRVALVGAIVDDFETKWVAGQQIELSEYLQACRTQCRLLALLGLQRRARNITGDDIVEAASAIWSPMRSRFAAERDEVTDAEIIS
jgi:hypothetical protein